MDYKGEIIKVKPYLSLFLFLFISACVAQDFPSVSAEQAAQMKEEADSVIFVDVRTPEEYSGPLGHIEDAILIPLGTLETDVNKLNDYKDKKLVVYCRSGNRSQSATRLLREKGFNAINMLGGIKAWNALKNKE